MTDCINQLGARGEFRRLLDDKAELLPVFGSEARYSLLKHDLAFKYYIGSFTDLMGDMTRPEVAASLVDAYSRGMTDLCRGIIGLFGNFDGFAVDLAGKGYGFNPILICPDGSEIALGAHFFNKSLKWLTDYESLQDLFMVGLDSGIVGLCSASSGEYLISSLLSNWRDDLINSDEAYIQSALSGIELPFLSGGLLNCPELLMAGSEREVDLLTPVFNTMLCWATPEVVAAFPDDLNPLVPVRQFRRFAPGSGIAHAVQSFNNFDYVDFDLVDQPFLDSIGDIDPVQYWKGYRLGLAGCDGVISLSGESAIHLYGNKSIKLGLYEMPGRTLCYASAEFLGGFQVSEYSDDLLSLSRQFFSVIVPVRAVIASPAESSGVRNHFNVTTITSSYSLHPLFREMLDDETRQGILSLITPAMLRYLIANPPKSCNPQFELAKVKHLGLDRLPVKARITRSTIEQLAQNGYIFASGSNLDFSFSVLASMSLTSIVSVLVGISEDGVIINGVPVGLRAKLKDTAGHHEGDIGYEVLKEVIRSKGLEAAKQAISSGDDWPLLFDVFGVDEFMDLLPMMPSDIKKEIVLSDFNI